MKFLPKVETRIFFLSWTVEFCDFLFNFIGLSYPYKCYLVIGLPYAWFHFYIEKLQFKKQKKQSYA